MQTKRMTGHVEGQLTKICAAVLNCLKLKVKKSYFKDSIMNSCKSQQQGFSSSRFIGGVTMPVLYRLNQKLIVFNSGPKLQTQ